MFSTLDTIVAIATPSGRGGIGVVRLSGPDALGIAAHLLARAAPLEPRHATFGTIRLTHAPRAPDEKTSEKTAHIDDPEAVTDHVIVTSFPAPASYTGEDVVEVSAHGSPVVLRGIVAAAIRRGARLAAPGEFTLRAYLNGRLDLVQAEAVADLIDAVTPLQAKTAFDQLQGTLTCAIGDLDRMLFDLVARLEASVDFPDEGYHFVDRRTVADEIDAVVNGVNRLLARAHQGRLVREGLTVAIVGRPNVGKSSLFNALIGSARAIVTPVPGTTRDLVTETIDLEGMPLTLVDTAGVHETTDEVELEGVARSKLAARVADLVLRVEAWPGRLSENGLEEALPHTAGKSLVVLNKVDLATDGFPSERTPRDVGRSMPVVAVSALTGEGLDGLKHRILEALDVDVQSDGPALTNVRHIALVEQARDALLLARQAVLADGGSLPEEFVLADLQDARRALEEISGRRAPEDLLEHIFSRFCIGK